MHWIVHLKMTQMADFMSHIFYYNLEKKNKLGFPAGTLRVGIAEKAALITLSREAGAPGGLLLQWLSTPRSAPTEILLTCSLLACFRGSPGSTL